MEYERVYDAQTFEALMERMLSRIPDTLDKREGSVIWDALAPAALELEVLYFELDDLIKNSFGSTAERRWLIERAKERDVHPKPATASEVKGKFNVELPEGARFNFEQVNFRRGALLEESGGFFFYALHAEEAGRIGNVPAGTLTPIETVPGLQVAEIVELRIPGEDEEETEAFRERYFDSLKRDDYGGNIDDYRRKVRALKGVGGVKVYPVWKGPGTVRLVIQSSEFGVPSTALVGSVQTAVDPVTNHAEGIGIAPIGHTVTVEAVTGVSVNISWKVLFESGYSWGGLKDEIERAAKEYLQELAKEWQKKETLVVRMSALESRTLAIKGVLDILDTTINGEAKNLTLASDAMPILGVVSNA